MTTHALVYDVCLHKHLLLMSWCWNGGMVNEIFGIPSDLGSISTFVILFWRHLVMVGD
ncbi:hypothetical protein HanPSC8_Chr17g0753921 [Helianthus annuus]|nr:hypothetical protein HanPSC8_Chr17g0753921 [Helianthus annuus]